MSYYLIPTYLDSKANLRARLSLRIRFRAVLQPRHSGWVFASSSQLRRLHSEGKLPQDVAVVPNSLASLMTSMEAYPPALALTENAFRQETLSLLPVEIFDMTEQLLLQHYKSQRNTLYFLAQAVNSDTMNFPNGGYYWILGVGSYIKGREKPSVLALCPDHQIYSTPIGYWDFDVNFFATRFGIEQGIGA